MISMFYLPYPYDKSGWAGVLRQAGLGKGVGSQEC